jgi:hypothetical protein
MDLAQIATVLVSILGGAGTVGGAWLESRRRAKREAAIEATSAQKTALEERSDLLALINEQLLNPMKEELRDVRERLKLAEDKIGHLEDTNDRLVSFIYKLIGLARTHGYDKEILPADVPPGIHL